MRFKATAILLWGLLLLVGCGESEEDRESRLAIDSSVRQIDAIYQDIDEGKSAEEKLTRVEMGNYYREIRSRFQEVRSDLAKVNLTENYRPTRSLLDTVITYSVRLTDLRQEHMRLLFEANSASSDFNRNLERAVDARSSRYRSSSEYLIEALSSEMEFEEAKLKLDGVEANYDSVGAQLEEFASEYNGRVAESRLSDSLKHFEALARPASFMDQMTKVVKLMEMDYGGFQEFIDRAKEEADSNG